MGKLITMESVKRLGGIRLKDLVGVKGSNVAVDIIHEAIQKDNIRVGCIGLPGTGKTSVLKAVMQDIGYFNEKETCDEVIDERDAKFVTSKRCRFFTMHANNIEDMIERLKLQSGKSVIEPCLIITCKDSIDKKYIYAIDEITVLDGVNNINNLAICNKDKIHKINDCTL